MKIGARKKRGERGFALVAAIFLLVVLSALAAAMASFSGMQNTASALDEQGARAYQAARAGIEWGLYQSLKPATKLTCPPSPGSSSATFVPAASSLAGFSVTVTCESATLADPLLVAPEITVRQLTAIACNLPNGVACIPSGADYVERRIRVSFDAAQAASILYRRELHY